MRQRSARVDVQDVHERLAELVLSGPADEVVDLGAGQGHTLVEVARRSPQSGVTAVDLAEDALAVLSASLPLECLLDPAALGLLRRRYLRQATLSR